MSSKISCLSYIETFAGCGGLSLGLYYAGWHGVFAVERDPMAFSTLKRNLIDSSSPYHHFKQWPVWLPKRNLNIEELLDNKQFLARLSSYKNKLDLIAGGPPCQGFSVGGARDGADIRNELVFKHLELINLIKPKIALIENVEGITRAFQSKPSDLNQPTAYVVLNILKELGYSSDYYQVLASDFGVPQRRRRIIIVGFREDVVEDFCSDSLFEKSVKSIFQKELVLASKYVRRYFRLPLEGDITVKDAIEDLSSSKIVPCPDSFGYWSSPYLKARSSYALAMRKGIKENLIPDSHRFSNHGKQVKNLYVLAHETQKPGRLPRDFLLKNGTKTHKKVLLDPNSVSTTLTTHPDEQIHFKFPRNISLREMARFQSFPDDFYFLGRYTLNGPRRKLDVPRCAQIGNAVPPLLGFGIGIALKQMLLSKTRKSCNQVMSFG